MEILLILLGFYLINFITNRLAVISPLLSALVYFISVMALFSSVNKIRLNRLLRSNEKKHQKQNRQFHDWQKNSSSKNFQYQSNGKIRDDIIEAEYTEREIKE